MPHPIDRERMPRGFRERRAVDRLHAGAAFGEHGWDRCYATFLQIVAREDAKYARYRERALDIKVGDIGMRMGRTYEDRMGLPRDRDVVGVLARSG